MGYVLTLGFLIAIPALSAAILLVVFRVARDFEPRNRFSAKDEEE